MTTKLFLTGYEKETIEEFIDKLQTNGIEAVIDVREIPLSRKNGFSKVNLERELRNRKIKYYNFPKLGSPSVIRNDLKTQKTDYLNFFRKYRHYLKANQSSLAKVAKIAFAEKISTLLCFERQTELCHRSIIASAILKSYPHLQVIPL